MLTFKKKMYFTIMGFSILTSVLVVALLVWSLIDGIYLDEIPNVPKDYFNGWVNQEGKEIPYNFFHTTGLFNVWGFKLFFWNTLTGSIMFIIIYATLCIGTIALYGEVMARRMPDRFLYFVASFMIFMILLNCIQLLIYFDPKTYETILRIHINDVFEKNFLIKTVGEENLNNQIISTAREIRNYYNNRFDLLVIFVLIASFILLILTTSWISGVIFLKRKFPNYDQLLLKYDEKQKEQRKARKNEKRKSQVF